MNLDAAIKPCKLVINKLALRLFFISIRMELMNNWYQRIDFHFTLAIIVILGTAGSLYLQFNEADNEFDTLNGSMYSIVRSRGIDLKEDEFINHELDKLGESLNALKF